MKRTIPIIFIFLLIFSELVYAEGTIYNSAAPEIAFTEEEQYAIDNYKELKVLIKGDSYPFSYYENGEYKGIYPDYLDNISELSGIKFTYVPYESDEQIESYFTLGKADAIAGTYGGWQGLYNVTEPYTILEYNVIARVNEDISKDKPHTVAVSGTDIAVKNYIFEHYPNWSIIPCRNINDAIKKVNSKKADITLLTSVDLQTTVSLLKYKNVKVVEDFSVYIPIGLAVSSVSCPDGLRTFFNKFIICQPLWDNEDVLRHYILNGIYVPDMFEFIIAHNEIMILILGIVLILITAIFIRWNILKRAAATDSLTKLWNREKFMKEAAKKLKDHKDKDFLMAALDVERFKLVNDRFGIEIGNQTLVQIGNKIKKIFKGNGIYAHGSGDEFLIFAMDTPENRERMNKAAELDVKINNTTNYKLPIKVGVCPVTYNDITENDITAYLDRAKIAKSKIKGHPDNGINYFTRKMGDKLNKENELQTIMRKSLENNEFLIYYQPKYNLENNKIIGAEALVRWQHPTKGLISPGDFVPLFEKNGFIVDVDFYVYECVMKMLSRRIDQKKRVVPVSMNVSRCHLNSPTFTLRLEELADKYNIPKDVIEMEITESIFSDEDRAAIKLMYDLKKRNFTLSMDDFGSGYSSLNLLRELPIDTLKIDKGFLETTDESVRSRVIVEEIISMATKINIKTICEGVETEQQRDFLKQAGCDMAQGFFYARPMPLEEFEELLDNEK